MVDVVKSIAETPSGELSDTRHLVYYPDIIAPEFRNSLVHGSLERLREGVYACGQGVFRIFRLT